VRWENKVHFDCLLYRQHFCQKLSQSNYVCKYYSKSKVGRFLRHSVLHYYILLLLSVLGRPLQVTVRRMLRDRCPVCPVCNVGVGMGDAAPPTERDSSLSPTYRPMSLVAKRSPISETAGLLLFNRLSFTELGWARTPN